MKWNIIDEKFVISKATVGAATRLCYALDFGFAGKNGEKVATFPAMSPFFCLCEQLLTTADQGYNGVYNVRKFTYIYVQRKCTRCTMDWTLHQTQPLP